jgi:hypothetical protein
MLQNCTYILELINSMGAESFLRILKSLTVKKFFGIYEILSIITVFMFYLQHVVTFPFSVYIFS